MEEIKVLSEKDRVRKKISVWLGSNNHNAVKHCIIELVGNSCDEINKGNGNSVTIELIDNKTICITDNCLGLPVEGMGQKEVEGVGMIDIPNYQLLTSHLFAGTKYENGINNDNYSVGINGVFLVVLSRASEFAEYEVARPDKNIYKFSYKKGDEKTPLTIIGTSDKTYTKITYKLDDEIFEENYYLFDEVCEIAQQQASLIKGSIAVIDKVKGVAKSFSYENGITDLIQHYNLNKSSLHDVIIFNGQDQVYVEKQKATDIMKISVAMQYTKEDENNSQIEFLNGSNLIHHGTIYDGLVNGIRKTIDKYLKNNGKYNKNEKSIKSEDILQGLNYIINFKSYFPVYANQTKFASYVVYYKDIMQNFIENQLEIYFIENKEIAEKITTQILINKRAREKSEQTRTDIKKKLESNISITNRIEGLIECKSKNKENNILCICEGKSALSAMISGRQDIHALFPIRGKILNCLKAPLDKILSNDVVLNLIKALGCGIEIKSNKKDMITFDISKLRYSKICIYVDADFDGMGSILPLLLTVFWKLTPTLVREGRIYVCETPKYEIVAGDKYYYAVDDKELESIQNKLKGKKYNLHYIKGLSELSAETMAMCLKPDYKNITKVGLGDVKKSIEMLELFMGNDVAPRRDYIISNFDVGD